MRPPPTPVTHPRLPYARLRMVYDPAPRVLPYVMSVSGELSHSWEDYYATRAALNLPRATENFGPFTRNPRRISLRKRVSDDTV